MLLFAYKDRLAAALSEQIAFRLVGQFGLPLT
jgi:hypothetical protein